MLSLNSLLSNAFKPQMRCLSPRFARSPVLHASQFSSVKNSLGAYFANKHPKNNVPLSIVEKLDKKLHLTKNHPLNIIKSR